MAEHRHRHFATIVPVAERGDVLGEVVRQVNRRIDELVPGEEAAVVGRNVHIEITHVDKVEETEKIPPNWHWAPLVLRLERALKQAIAHEIAPLRESDEENAVEDLLRWLDCRAERELRAIGGID